MNRSGVYSSVGPLSDGRDLPLYPTTTLSNSHYLVRSVIAGVIQTQVIALGTTAQMDSMMNCTVKPLLCDIGAGVSQQLNAQWSGLCFLISVVITLAMLIDYRRHSNSKWLVLAATCLTCLHPAWTVSGTGGDLGYSQRTCSFIVTAIVAGLLLMLFFAETNDT